MDITLATLGNSPGSSGPAMVEAPLIRAIDVPVWPKYDDSIRAVYRDEAAQANLPLEFDIDPINPHTGLAYGKDPQVLTNGLLTFVKLCAPCHRADGGGLVGPNLCDDYWIHGSNFVDNVTTIWNGVPAKGMVTWKTSLRPAQVYEVASFIYTLRGTNPRNPKPPENQTPVKTGPSEFE